MALVFMPFSDALNVTNKTGVSKPTLSRLLKAKLITRLEHGLYIKSEADFPNDLEFVIACHKFGPEAARTDKIGSLLETIKLFFQPKASIFLLC